MRIVKILVMRALRKMIVNISTIMGFIIKNNTIKIQIAWTLRIKQHSCCVFLL